MLVRIWNNRSTHLLLWEMKNTIATLEDSLSDFYKSKLLLLQDHEVMPLDICPNELKTYPHKHLHMDIFTASLLKIAKTWNVFFSR